MNKIGVSTMNGEAIAGGNCRSQTRARRPRVAASNWRMVTHVMGPGKPRESSSKGFLVNSVSLTIIHAAGSTALRGLTSSPKGQLKVKISLVDQVTPSKWRDSLYKTMRRQRTQNRFVRRIILQPWPCAPLLPSRRVTGGEFRSENVV
jgi:hypothetical protein